ncbi:MAG TPA: pyridoxal phosphate-dependent aminotransferase [Miltoncostaeales bacterium]|nr:pyridoxal phosphate-dependent aminotransferase [Miltoncostaeales bacterium]
MSTPARIARRAAAIAPFEVMEVLRRAGELEAAGHDVIHMEVGEPDFPTPQPIVRAAQTALGETAMTYTPALGIPALRAAIAAHYGERFGIDIDAARIVVTNGSSAALLLALGLVLDAGDEVLMGDPTYPCNRHFVTFVDGVATLVPTDANTGYQVTADLLSGAWTERTRAVITASPSNPTGTSIATDELGRIAALCGAHGASFIADEIYQGLTYGHEPHTALAVTDSAYVVNSFSKYFQMTGWRLGWLVAPPGVTRDIEKLAQNLYICPPTLSQHAALAAFAPETIAILEERRRELQARRDALLTALPSIGFEVRVVPDGAFYIYCDVSGITDDSFAFAGRVLEQAHVAITPGRDFGVAAPKRHVRIAYTQPIPRLLEAVERIAAVLRHG